MAEKIKPIVIHPNGNASNLPEFRGKPQLIHGYASEIFKHPIITNFSHILRWLYENCVSKADVKKMVQEEVARQLAGGAGQQEVVKITEIVETIKTQVTPAEQNTEAVIVPAVTLAGLYEEVEQLRKALIGDELSTT